MQNPIRHTILYLALLVSVAASHAQTLEVGIYHSEQPRAAWVKVEKGTFILYGNKEQLTMLDTSQSVFIQWNGKSFKVQDGNKTYKGLASVHVMARSYKGELRIKPDSDKLKEHIYPGSLKWQVKDGSTQMINLVDLEDYTAGVVESESGREQNLEFYKVQSIICRTYALSNIRKHEEEGFELCDKVHCQVYHGKARFNEDIPKAVNETHGYVLVDSDINLVTAAFHSNCGGHTINSEHVWSKPLPYLIGRKDTFCLSMPHAVWQKEIAKSEWQQYLDDRTDDSSRSRFSDVLPGLRVNYLHYDEHKIPVKQVRNDWQLPSTYFSLEESDEVVRLKGKGFGHGVGLCQEGAMSMSKLGYNYREILHFYYDSVHLIKLTNLDFFRDKTPEGLED